MRLAEEKLLRRSVGGGKQSASQAPTGQSLPLPKLLQSLQIQDRPPQPSEGVPPPPRTEVFPLIFASEESAIIIIIYKMFISLEAAAPGKSHPTFPRENPKWGKWGNKVHKVTEPVKTSCITFETDFVK